MTVIPSGEGMIGQAVWMRLRPGGWSARMALPVRRWGRTSVPEEKPAWDAFSFPAGGLGTASAASRHTGRAGKGRLFSSGQSQGSTGEAGTDRPH
jgi:hypothetical protein